MNTDINVLIVDESPVYRDIFVKSLLDFKDIKVVGKTLNESIAEKKIELLNPDLLIIDVSLPDFDPEAFTLRVLSKKPRLGILLTCLSNSLSAEKTIKGLESGAYDFIVKPDDLNENESIDYFRRILPAKIRTFSTIKFSLLTRDISGKSAPSKKAKQKASEKRTHDKEILSTLPAKSIFSTKNKYKAILIGASTGGPEALSTLISNIPSTFEVPIIIAIHMPKLFTASLSNSLDKKAHIKVEEASDNTPILPNRIYIARGGKDVGFIKDNSTVKIVYKKKSVKSLYTPSIDNFFESASKVFAGNVVSVLLTGMGDDGALGMSKLKTLGSKTIVQDEETSIIWGMPGTAVKANCVDEVLPIEKIAQQLISDTCTSKPPIEEQDISISSDEFNLLRSYLLKICGIDISPEKSYLFSTRLVKLLAEENYSSFTEFYNHISKKFDVRIQKKIIELMTTNETSFFRDKHPYETLSYELLNRISMPLLKDINPSIRIWSAGCSRGHEPYSIAISVLEWISRQTVLRKENFSIFASDISQEVLRIAKAGVYPDYEVNKIIAPNLVEKYFTRRTKGYELKNEVKSMITFGELNLSEPFEYIGGFNLIFCRNVMIYFSPPFKERILERFYNLLHKDGALLVGASETLYKMSKKFKSFQFMKTTYYVPENKN